VGAAAGRVNGKRRGSDEAARRAASHRTALD
jgi:hypothetical protein